MSNNAAVYISKATNHINSFFCSMLFLHSWFLRAQLFFHPFWALIVSKELEFSNKKESSRYAIFVLNHQCILWINKILNKYKHLNTSTHIHTYMNTYMYVCDWDTCLKANLIVIQYYYLFCVCFFRAVAVAIVCLCHFENWIHIYIFPFRIQKPDMNTIYIHSYVNANAYVHSSFWKYGFLKCRSQIHNFVSDELNIFNTKNDHHFKE